jgi:AraC-like DNA-binding protein
MELLVQDNMPIEAVAQSIGYSSLNSFTGFIKRTRSSSSEYRQSNGPRCNPAGLWLDDDQRT